MRRARGARRAAERQQAELSEQAKRLEHHAVVDDDDVEEFKNSHIRMALFVSSMFLDGGQPFRWMMRRASRACDRDDEPWSALGIRSR